MNRRVFISTTPLLAVSMFMLRAFFKGNSTPEAVNFRQRVLKLAKSTYPTVSFEAPEQNADVVIAGGMQIGLQNLKAKFDQSDQSQQALEQLVAEHFQFVLQDEPSVPDFDVARPRLKPQLMPPEYTEQAPIISFPFGQSLAIGIVLDAEKGYLYLKHEDAIRWNKSHKELLDIAIANLDEASRKMQMQFSENDDVKWIAIEAKDGFDAARILIPRLREFLANRLGGTFRFAVPNRDFLICWNSNASARFVEFTKSNIQKDFANQPYPLSPYFFKVTSDGTVTEQKFD